MNDKQTGVTLTRCALRVKNYEQKKRFLSITKAVSRIWYFIKQKTISSHCFVVTSC